jgi:predicted AlkP superfamily phosphohydrolase/phosphomutase
VKIHKLGGINMSRANRLFLIGYDGMNYPLLRRFINEGVLPTFKKLLARGSLNRLLPTFPAWTPTNWASIVTGAPSGTTRLGGWTVRRKTDPWDKPLSMSWEHKTLGGTETLWEVADQSNLRNLITHYPTANWGIPLKNGYVVAPGLHDAPFSYAGAMEYFVTTREDVQSSVEVIGEVMENRTTDREEEGALPGTAVTRLSPAHTSGWRNVTERAWGAPLPIVMSGGQHTDNVYLLVEPASNRQFERISVCAEPDGERIITEIPKEGWSAFAFHRLGPDKREAAMRFRILKIDESGRALHLVRTVAYGTEGFTQPDSLGPEILKECGPFYDLASVDPVVDDQHLSVWLDDMRYMGEWEVNVARYVQETYGWDLQFSHWHAFDFINHATVNGIDPGGPNFDPDRAAWLLDAQRKTYVLGDEILAQFLQLTSDDDIVCVASDHAITPTHRTGSLPDRMVEAGLIAVDSSGRIDRSRSKVYVLAARGSEVYVNLENREPGGIVPRNQYEYVQEEIIDALLDWRDPANNKRLVAFALKLQDAPIVGYWGDISGDVVFAMNRGYAWGQVYDTPSATSGPSVGASRSAIHGSQIPTSETLNFTNMACFLIAGPGVKAGYERDYQRWGLMRMIDLTPTFSKLLGLRTPQHSMGAVLYDLLTE